jgi:hypothetical protein
MLPVARRRLLERARVALLLAVSTAAGGCAWLAGPDAAALASAESLRGIEERWGIRPLGVRMTAAGYALDFRYRVLDAEKAAPVLVRKYSRDPKLIVERSGAVLHVPFSEKVGTMRQSVRSENMVKEDKNYFVLFANPGRYVKPGDLVTIQIGEYRQEHVAVE